jgi:hypothetical protein
LYLYILNRPSFEDEIAQLECLFLTGTRTDRGFAFSETYVDEFRPAYMGTCIEAYFIENDLELLYKKINTLNYTMDNYRVRFINTGDHIDFNTRKLIERNISDIFEGAPDLKNPVDDFIITFTGDSWAFGKMLWKTKMNDINLLFL